jgi:hypothetical protein
LLQVRECGGEGVRNCCNKFFFFLICIFFISLIKVSKLMFERLKV